MKRLKRSDTDKVFLGICGGMGEYLGIDSTAVRVLWVIADVFTGFLTLAVIYVILAFVIPPDDGIIDV